MNDKWNDLQEWEDKHKIAVFMTISVDDVRDYGNDWLNDEALTNQIAHLTDEELWEAIQHVSRKYDFGDVYRDIYEWAIGKAQEWKESENA